MKISFSATNPCHIYDQAKAVHELGHLGVFFSGYPRWRLAPPASMPVVTASWRTLVTYGLQRLPERLRPPDDRVFRWQDAGFDRSVARLPELRRSDALHCLPGQALESFRRARAAGVLCVLNHASGPLLQQRELIRAEYLRAGLDLERLQPLPAPWRRRLEQEMELADRHCVASTVVRDQLVAEGIAPERIWVVPYGLDEARFPKRDRPPEGAYRVCFAGRQSLRKGLFYLLRALERVAAPDWELHVFGMPLAETSGDLAAYRGAARIIQHGAVSQREFAAAMRDVHVLVLPSAEEAFGLVVLQALQCGVPCIVSDRVGAKDLLRPGETGTVFPFGDVDQLAAALLRWEQARGQVADRFPYRAAAERLVALTAAALERGAGRT